MGQKTSAFRTKQYIDGLNKAIAIAENSDDVYARINLSSFLTLMLDANFRNCLTPVDDGGYRWIFYDVEIKLLGDSSNLPNSEIEFVIGKGPAVKKLRTKIIYMFSVEAGMLHPID